MKIPNGSQAVIRPEKLRDYLLNIEHKRGKSKAEVLLSFGYSPEKWRTLESDLRQYHLKADVTAMRDTPYGKRYEIRAFLETPSSRSLMVRKLSLRRPTAEDRPMVRQPQRPQLASV